MASAHGPGLSDGPLRPRRAAVLESQYQRASPDRRRREHRGDRADADRWRVDPWRRGGGELARIPPRRTRAPGQNRQRRHIDRANPFPFRTPASMTVAPAPDTQRAWTFQERAARACQLHSIAMSAVECLLLELQTWPKPGLVSHIDCGSHADMD